MVQEQIKKLTLLINTVILILVFGLMGFFYLSDAWFLVWFSIPTAGVYLTGFYLIKKDMLDLYVRLVYGWLTLYMSLATLCLGYSFGFHLYSISMIPIIFYTEYMAYQLKTRSFSTTLYSALAIAAYLITTGYSLFNEPVYKVDSRIAGVFFITNSIVVLGFVTFYSKVMIKMVIAAEEKLSDRANKDRLTHLFNRHYMMEQLKEAYEDDHYYYIAMIDIDNFKGINDNYGHGGGDEVLRKVAMTMEKHCQGSTVSRWGGEEFLILTKEATDLIESLREEVESMTVDFEDKKISFTITAGVAKKDKSIKLDKWIDAADEKLYFGKNNGKNRVVT